MKCSLKSPQTVLERPSLSVEERSGVSVCRSGLLLLLSGKLHFEILGIGEQRGGREWEGRTDLAKYR